MPVKGSKWGTAHQKLRAKLIARWRPGDPCSRCGLPMLGPSRYIHLGHNDSGNGYRGLEHARCNESAGGVVGAERQGKTPRSKVCPICHAPYTATRTSQIACCREHADAAKRGDAPWPLAGRAW